jgi:hypothetical protein
MRANVQGGMGFRGSRGMIVPASGSAPIQARGIAAGRGGSRRGMYLRPAADRVHRGSKQHANGPHPLFTPACRGSQAPLSRGDDDGLGPQTAMLTDLGRLQRTCPIGANDEDCGAGLRRKAPSGLLADGNLVFPQNLEVARDGVTDVRLGFIHRLPLTHATGQRGHVRDVALVVRVECEHHLEVHIPIMAQPPVAPEAVAR